MCAHLHNENKQINLHLILVGSKCRKSHLKGQNNSKFHYKILRRVSNGNCWVLVSCNAYILIFDKYSVAMGNVSIRASGMGGGHMGTLHYFSTLLEV